jgi:electron transport complex protein RnfC
MIKGIKLDGKKEVSISNEIVDFSDPNEVYVPLINNGVLCECVTNEGRKIRKGTVIGIRKDIDFPILSPVSGTVVGVEEGLYLNNKDVSCVVIKNDKREKLVEKKLIEDITSYSKEGFIDTLKKCAVTGMGGSDFPTFIKYKNGVEILIVNAVECEPYITSDLMLVKLKAEIILETINAIMKINGIKKCFIAYKKHNKIISSSFLKYINKYENIYLSPVKDLYPMGWERSIIKSILKLEYDRFPSEIGVVVNNVSTIFAIYKALKFQRAITKRIVTISGENFNEPVNVLAKVGTDFSTIIRKIGSYVDKKNIRIISGGPMMGFSLKNDSVIVTNNLNSVIVLYHEEEEINECISCGKCINICPSNLCPVFIMKNVENKEKLVKLHPEYCCECGLCSYICPSKIKVREYVKEAKKEVKK